MAGQSKNFNAPLDLSHMGSKGLQAHYADLLEHLKARPANTDPKLPGWCEQAEILRLHVAVAASREVA